MLLGIQMKWFIRHHTIHGIKRPSLIQIKYTLHILSILKYRLLLENCYSGYDMNLLLTKKRKKLIGIVKGSCIFQKPPKAPISPSLLQFKAPTFVHMICSKLNMRHVHLLSCIGTTTNAADSIATIPKIAVISKVELSYNSFLLSIGILA